MFPYPGDKKATQLIYNKFGQEFIYEYYLGWCELDKKMPSPFRDDHLNPSFNLYNDNGIIRWNDHGRLPDKINLSQRDCIGYVMQSNNLNRIGAIKKIWSDLKGHSVMTDQINAEIQSQTKKKKPASLSIRKNWKPYELSWWNFIDTSLLKKERIYPTEELKIGNKVIKSSVVSPSFTYLYKDAWKVYSPYLTKDKWKSHNMNGVIDGWEQLSKFGETLYIVSSKTDRLVMETYICKNTLAPPSENNLLQLLGKSKELNARFKDIFVSFDADKTGYENTYKLCELTGWKPVYLPKDYLRHRIKDQKDIIKKLGYLKLRSIYGL